MRKQHLSRLLLIGWLSIVPLAARADDLADARKAMQTGDLRTALIDLRNAVRSDPQNADAHFWLGRVSLELGDPVAAEREARAAWDRGFDPRPAATLLAQSLLAQQKYRDLLAELNPDGKDPTLDASILVARGYAQIALGDADAGKASFALAEKAAPDTVEPLLATAQLLMERGEFDAAQAKIDRALELQPRSPDALLARADLLRSKGSTKDALVALDQLLADQPGNVRALLERARLLVGAAEFDKAAADLAGWRPATCRPSICRPLCRRRQRTTGQPMLRSTGSVRPSRAFRAAISYRASSRNSWARRRRPKRRSATRSRGHPMTWPRTRCWRGSNLPGAVRILPSKPWSG